MDENLKRMQGQAVDINKAMDDREKEREASEAAAMEAANERVRVWSKNMTRAFKGIFPTSHRKAFMRAEIKRMEREA